MIGKTKKFLMGLALLFIGLVITSLGTGLVYAAGDASEHKMKHVHWHFDGPLGTYDRASAQRGYQVYREVCASCHQLEQLAFRHLGDKGAPFYDKHYPNPNENPLVKNFAADWEVEEVDLDTGDINIRPGIPADYFPAIYPNSAAAAASNGGAIPPDLSVMVKARGGGADYVHNLLISYGLEMPHDFKLSPGTYYNPVMEGGAIAMAPPLSDDLVEYADGTPATVEQMARDVTEFLAWSADPKMEIRKSAGIATMIYLLILTVLMWLSYKTVWRGVKH